MPHLDDLQKIWENIWEKLKSLECLCNIAFHKENIIPRIKNRIKSISSTEAKKIMSSYDKFLIAVLAAKNCTTSQSYIYLSYLCLILKTVWWSETNVWQTGKKRWKEVILAVETGQWLNENDIAGQSWIYFLMLKYDMISHLVVLWGIKIHTLLV